MGTAVGWSQWSQPPPPALLRVGGERRGEGRGRRERGATGGRSNGEAAFDRLGAPSAGHERPRACRTKGDAEFS